MQHLRDDLYVEWKEHLLIERIDHDAMFCTGYYNRETKEKLPLTPEKYKYLETLPVDIM